MDRQLVDLEGGEGGGGAELEGRGSAENFC